eukprot:scaffold6941_cov214-Pinguiococcus_pyrenoidosus.AAC.6
MEKIGSASSVAHAGSCVQFGQPLESVSTGSCRPGGESEGKGRTKSRAGRRRTLEDRAAESSKRFKRNGRESAAADATPETDGCFLLHPHARHRSF